MAGRSSCGPLILIGVRAQRMIGIEFADILKKICKVHQRVADEAIEQRGSYSKVIRASGKIPTVSE
jgi:hypothetical protein